MFRCKKTIFLLASIFYLAFHVTSGQDCDDDDDDGGRGRPVVMGRGPPRRLDCEQQEFENWDMEVNTQELDDDGRTPGITSHNKETNYYLNTTQWCEGIRPCPVHSGTPSLSRNNHNPTAAFKHGDTWRTDDVSADDIRNGGVWAKYSYDRADLAVGFLLFQPCNQINRFVFEGSKDDKTWEELPLSRQGMSSTLWEFKVVHSSTVGPKSFKHYRLRVTETKWSAEGATSGSVSIGNIQFCLMDIIDVTNDNPYVASPPYIADPHATAFASSRWGRNWHEKFAFTNPSTAWSSKYIYKRSGRSGELANPEHIGYSFPIPRIIRKIRFMGSYQSKYMMDHPKEFLFQVRMLM